MYMSRGGYTCGAGVHQKNYQAHVSEHNPIGSSEDILKLDNPKTTHTELSL